MKEQVSKNNSMMELLSLKQLSASELNNKGIIKCETVMGQ